MSKVATINDTITWLFVWDSMPFLPILPIMCNKLEWRWWAGALKAREEEWTVGTDGDNAAAPRGGSPILRVTKQQRTTIVNQPDSITLPWFQIWHKLTLIIVKYFYGEYIVSKYGLCSMFNTAHKNSWLNNCDPHRIIKCKYQLAMAI